MAQRRHNMFASRAPEKKIKIVDGLKAHPMALLQIQCSQLCSRLWLYINELAVTAYFYW